MAESKAQKSLKRKEISDLIESAGLVGQTIKVVKVGGRNIKGELKFYFNRNKNKNTGYYINNWLFGEIQIPLLSVKEVGGDYLII
jgi:hypothetical protein